MNAGKWTVRCMPVRDGTMHDLAEDCAYLVRLQRMMNAALEAELTVSLDDLEAYAEKRRKQMATPEPIVKEKRRLLALWRSDPKLEHPDLRSVEITRPNGTSFIVFEEKRADSLGADSWRLCEDGAMVLRFKEFFRDERRWTYADALDRPPALTFDRKLRDVDTDEEVRATTRPIIDAETDEEFVLYERQGVVFAIKVREMAGWFAEVTKNEGDD